MNRTTKVEREPIIAGAAQLMEHNDPSDSWCVTNHDHVIDQIMREFGVGKDRAQTALGNANRRYHAGLTIGNTERTEPRSDQEKLRVTFPGLEKGEAEKE